MAKNLRERLGKAIDPYNAEFVASVREDGMKTELTSVNPKASRDAKATPRGRKKANFRPAL